jgi:hypothetical protein
VAVGVPKGDEAGLDDAVADADGDPGVVVEREELKDAAGRVAFPVPDWQPVTSRPASDASPAVIARLRFTRGRTGRIRAPPCAVGGLWLS